MNKTTDLKEILSPLADHLNKVDRVILDKLQTGIPSLDNSALHLFQSGGKRIRAAIIILTSGITGPVPPGTIELAAAAEIVHAASLIHDDIIDHSLLRRGDVSVPYKWGNKISVLAGDFMYTVALRTAVDDLNPAIFPLLVDATGDMVLGELYQLQFSHIDTVSRDHYLKTIEYKTARFLAACAKLGATKAKLSNDQCDMLYNFGLNLGFAFQIIDDTLDIVVDSSETGKDAGNDLIDGKITLPFLIMMEHSSNDRTILKNFADKPGNGWKIIKNRLEEIDAINESISYAGDYIAKANEILEKFPESEFRSILFNLTNFLLYRKY